MKRQNLTQDTLPGGIAAGAIKLVCLCFLVTVLLTQVVSAATVQVSPGGLSAAINDAGPGDTLVLESGEYEYFEIRDRVFNGSPLTIRAKKDGQAVVLGFGFVSCDNIVVEGLVVKKRAAVIGTYYCSNITFRRVTAYGTQMQDDNQHIWQITASDNVLMEDCAATGYGRYVILFYGSENITARRCYAKWIGHSVHQGPRCAFSIYGSRGVTMENCIGHNAQPVTEGVVAYYGLFVTYGAHNADRFVPRDINIRGCLFFDNFHGGVGKGGLLASRAPYQGYENVTYKDSVFFDHPLLPTPGSCDLYPCWSSKGRGVVVASDEESILNCTFAGNNLAIKSIYEGGRIENNIFMDNEQGMDDSNAGQAYCNFWNNGIDGATLDTTDMQKDPGFNYDKYGMGANFFIPSDSPLKGAGENGSDIGANVIYQYEDGELTDEPLWPWPMEDRIANDFGQSVTWEQNGGFWKTLDGVYAEAPSNISDTYSVAKSPITPVIDGNFDEYALAPAIVLTNANGTKGYYKLMWDDNYLYIAADVSDSYLHALQTSKDGALWNDDSIELFFDTQNDLGDSMNLNDYKFMVSILNTQLDINAINLSWDIPIESCALLSGTANDSSSDNGYSVEIAIAWAQWGAGSPNIGDIWGFDLSMNDSDGSGETVQTQWSNADGGTANNPDGWGKIQFGSAVTE
ncbi:MAG: hypothetical protein GY874_05320 [Desulfobacteraceae bacterium]|nr:hypothetical protein [Desulfobacteraceae bacterium]